MRRVTALLAGSVALAVSMPAFAVVSHVFVSNSGDQTLSVIRCVTANGKQPIRCEETDRMDVGFGTSWPANQYDGHPAWWWTGLSGEVIGIKARAALSPLKNSRNFLAVDTYTIPGRPDSGSNFIGISPDGHTAWNSAREVDRIQEIDTDPDSPSFGTILNQIPVPDQDMETGETATRGAARPCDATITPDGRFFLEPDLGGESLTVVDTWSKQIIYQVQPTPAVPDEKVLPFMATTNGKIVLIENLEADNTYDIWDITGLPNTAPLHLKKLTQSDGLGVNAQTSEFTTDGRYAFLIMNGVANADPATDDASRIDVLDVMGGSASYLQVVNHIELPLNCRAHTGDFSKDGRFFFVNCSGRDEVAVIDSAGQDYLFSIPVGTGPRGVVVR